ncbi:MAG: ABC transporter permease [Hyphomicrobiales bacterium]
MSSTPDVAVRSRLAPSRDVMQALYRLIAVVLLCAALTVLSDVFFTTNNILNVLRQTALLFLMASGLTLVILTAGLDLSVGANIALSACLAASVMKTTGSPLLGMATGIGCGAAVGFANGILVTALRIPSFIATYGMMWMLTGVTYYYMAGETIHGFPPGFRQLGSGYLFGVPMPVYIMMLFLFIGAFFAQRTVWGQQIYAIGANPVAARLSGVPVERRLVLVYAVSGAMAGLASLIILARINSAQGDIGEELTLPAIAAVLVGGTSLFGGSGTVAGTLIGALFLTLVLNGMNLLQIHSSWQPLVTGIIILLAVWIDNRTRRSDA